MGDAEERNACRPAKRYDAFKLGGAAIGKRILVVT